MKAALDVKAREGSGKMTVAKDKTAISLSYDDSWTSHSPDKHVIVSYLSDVYCCFLPFVSFIILTHTYLSLSTTKLLPCQLGVSHVIDENNTFKPAVTLDTCKVKYGWINKWRGGSLVSTLYPREKVVLKWVDESCGTGIVGGGWKTRVDLPLTEFGKTKISVGRDWAL